MNIILIAILAMSGHSHGGVHHPHTPRPHHPHVRTTHGIAGGILVVTVDTPDDTAQADNEDS
jgi:hypothetical protein